MGDYGPSHADLNPSTYPNHATTTGRGLKAPEPGEGKGPEQAPLETETPEGVEDQHVTVTTDDLSPAEQKALEERDNAPLEEGGGEDARPPAVEPKSEEEGNGVYLATSQVPGESDGGDAGEDDGYDDLTKPELQDQLREKDLPTSGNKDELIERLRNA